MKKLSILVLGLFLCGSLLQAQQTSIKSQSGGASSGSVATGCTPSTNVWVDASGLIQCGNTIVGMNNGALAIDGVASTGPNLKLFGGNATTHFTFSNNQAQFVELWPRDVITGAASFLQSTTYSFDGSICPNNSLGTAQGSNCLSKIATGVLGVSSGTWFQNTPGEGTLNANYTNATTTFSNTNLSRTVISGRTYDFDLNLLYSQSTAVDGWKIDFNGGTAAATNFVVNCSATAETGIIVVLANATSAALATVINATTTVTTGGQMIRCSGSFVPSGAGTFIVRAANNAATTGTLTIKRGSHIAMRDAPAL